MTPPNQIRDVPELHYQIAERYRYLARWHSIKDEQMDTLLSTLTDSGAPHYSDVLEEVIKLLHRKGVPCSYDAHASYPSEVIWLNGTRKLAPAPVEGCILTLHTRSTSTERWARVVDFPVKQYPEVFKYVRDTIGESIPACAGGMGVWGWLAKLFG